jgi:hypothetical protein
MPASPARLGTGLADRRFGGWLAALSLGLAALCLLAFPPAQAGQSCGGAPKPSVVIKSSVVVVMAAAKTPAQAPRLHRLDRDGPAIAAADIEGPSDPALPKVSAEAVPLRGSVGSSFAETSASVPSPAPLPSPLRPPRTA